MEFKLKSKVLLEKNVLIRNVNLDFAILDPLLQFLKQFKECSEKLSAEKVPTIHIYPLWLKKLVELCSFDCIDF